MSETRTTIDFKKLIKNSTIEELKKEGFQMWNKNIILIPEKFYNDIPDGMKLINIFNENIIFKNGISTKISRYGLLSYGFDIRYKLRNETIDKIL